MDMMFHLVAHARPSMEREKHQPEHIERGHERGDSADKP